MEKAVKPVAHASKSKLNFKSNENLRLVLLILITVKWFDGLILEWPLFSMPVMFLSLIQLSCFQAGILNEYLIDKAQGIKPRIDDLTLRWILVCYLLKFRLFKQTPLFRFNARIHFKFPKPFSNVRYMEIIVY